MGSSMRRRSWRRQARSLGGKVIRRLGLLPGGAPDGLGEDAALAGVRLPQRVLVFFADTRDGLYQLRQWYPVLEELDRHGGVVVVCMDSRTTASIRAETALAAHTVAQDSTLDALLADSDIKLALYVNYNPLNTLCLRARSVLHVNLLHGESDKAVSVSNQVKAYDFALVAGQAAVDRYREHTPLFDADARCLPIGRPQLDVERLRGDSRAAGTPATVLYAPTWEGASGAVAYGSVRSHGPAIVTGLLDAGYRVVYRPHPLTGVRDASYGEADAAIREILAASTGGVVSAASDIEDDFAAADLLISDVSAVVIDWLPTGRPIVVTVPANSETRATGSRLLEVVPQLPTSDLGRVGEMVSEQLADDPASAAREELTSYYLGDIRPGASLQAFLRTCDELCALRDREWARVEGTR